MQDNDIKQKDTYGLNLVRLLQEADYALLAGFVNSQSEQYWLRIASKYDEPNEQLIAEISSDQRLYIQQGHADNFQVDRQQEDWERLNSLAILVYGGFLEERLLTEPLTIEDVIVLGPKFAATIKNPALRVEKLDREGAFDDYQRILSLSPDRNAVITYVRDTGAARRMTFSSLFHAALRAGGLHYSDDSRYLMYGTDIISPVEMDPVFGLPLYISDVDAYARFLRRRTKTEVHVVKTKPYDIHLVAYVMANRTIEVATGKSSKSTISNTPLTGCFSGLYSARGSKFLQAFDRYIKTCPPPANLAGSEWLPTYVHYVIEQLLADEPVLEAACLAHLPAYIAGLPKTFADGLAVWNQYPGVKSVVDAIYLRKEGVPVESIGVACQHLAVRRDSHNVRNQPYNKLFRTSDPSVVGFEDDAVADMGKHTEILKFCDLSGVDGVDIYGVGQGNMIDPIRAIAPGKKIIGYDKTLMKRMAIAGTVWEIDEGYVGRHQFIYDVSYGEGDKIVATNSRKVNALLRSAYVSGVMKFTLTHESMVSGGGGNFELPYEMQKIATHFGDVRIVCPGKAHSPEIFVVFKDRLDDVDVSASATDRIMRMIGALYAKACLMEMSNTVRVLGWDKCAPLAWSDHMARYVGPIWDDVKRITAYGRSKVLQPYTVEQILNVVFSKKDAKYDTTEALGAVADYFSVAKSMSGSATAVVDRFLGNLPPTAREVPEKVRDVSGARGHKRHEPDTRMDTEEEEDVVKAVAASSVDAAMDDQQHAMQLDYATHESNIVK